MTDEPNDQMLARLMAEDEHGKSVIFIGDSESSQGIVTVFRDIQTDLPEHPGWYVAAHATSGYTLADLTDWGRNSNDRSA